MPSAFLSHRAGPAFSHSPCPAAAARLGSGVSFGQGTRLGADSPSPGSGDAGRAPGLGDTERALHPSAGNTALLADRGEHAWLGKGKPRHITETGAPSLSLSLSRPRCGCGGGGGAPAVSGPPPSPRGGGPPDPKGKALLPWPLFLERVPAAPGRDKGGEGPLPPRPHCRPGPTAGPAHALAHGDKNERGYLVHPIPHGLSDPHAHTAGEAVGRCCRRRVGVHGTVLAEGHRGRANG